MGKRLAALLLVCIGLLHGSVSAGALGANAVLCVPNEEKVIALTFDDGPHPYDTDKILAVLREYGIRATFFEIGCNVEAYPDVARRVSEAGCEIGNHTYTHPHLSKVTAQQLEDEVRRTDEIITRVTGRQPVLFRPPEGALDSPSCLAIERMGRTQILWSVDTNDWRGRRADQIAATVCRRVRGGDIILMHDYVSRKTQAPDALRVIIPRLLEEGYRFVTISELLETGQARHPSR